MVYKEIDFFHGRAPGTTEEPMHSSVLKTVGLPARTIVRATTSTCVLFLIALAVLGQENSRNAALRIGIPQDWSHRHVVFSKPDSLQAEITLQRDPRYGHQVLRR